MNNVNSPIFGLTFEQIIKVFRQERAQGGGGES